MKTFKIDVDFYSMEVTVKSKSKAEAKRKVKEKIKKGIGMVKHINHIYIDEL